jgi:small subunit ribosomal protein S4
MIKVVDKSRQMNAIHDSMKRVRDGKMVQWVSLDKASMEGSILEIPSRESIPVNVNEKLIVELYSK